MSNEPTQTTPIDMLLWCPTCHTQHVDAPDERTEGWVNPLHRSHLCHHCGTIWRPADVPTNGVAAIATRGKADTWARGVNHMSDPKTTDAAFNFGWTPACEREAARHTKRLTELVAEWVSMDSKLSASVLPIRDRVQAGSRLLAVKAEAEAILGRIACAG